MVLRRIRAAILEWPEQVGKGADGDIRTLFLLC